MADHTATGTVEGPGGTAAGPVLAAAHAADEAHHSGRPISWVAVVIICVGFIVGGVAMVPRPTWWAFWLGTGIAVVGIIIALFARTFNEDWY